jgi:hypothetical protein
MSRTRRAFDYKPPTYEEANRLSQRRGSMFDGIVKQNGPKFFKPKGGDNFIRIMPPTWENARHYALDVKIHRNVGADKQSYLCLTENEGSTEKVCPICQERQDMARERMARERAPQTEIDALRANTSLFIYLIDRSTESQGPQIWGISNRSDAEILSQSLEKRQQVYLPIAHPIDGFDVEFTREGEGLNTRYRGFKVARTSSPITDDPDRFEQWLNYIEDNPIPDILQFYPAERIKLVLHGKLDKDTDEPPTRVREEQVDTQRPRPSANGTGIGREVPSREGTPHNADDHGGTPHDDDPPFDVEERTVPRRAPLEATRPSPREASPEPERNRRATLDTGTTPDQLKASLREKLAGRRGGEERQ